MEIRWDFLVTAFFLLLGAVATAIVPRFPRAVSFELAILAAMFAAGMFVAAPYFVAWAIATLAVAAIAGAHLFLYYLKMLRDVNRPR
jgi:hypothetical protein